MVLCQFVITLDDILNAGATANGYTLSAVTGGVASFSNPATVLRNVNFPGGSYMARVVGLEIASGLVNTTSFAFQPQLIYINSSKFLFKGGGAPQGLVFANNHQFSLSDIKGNRDFEIDLNSGNVDLSIRIGQLGTFTGAQSVAPWLLSVAQTWTTAQFAYIILTLDLVECDKKALYGEAKNAFKNISM
jgi:hypothetical protein